MDKDYKKAFNVKTYDTYFILCEGLWRVKLSSRPITKHLRKGAILGRCAPHPFTGNEAPPGSLSFRSGSGTSQIRDVSAPRKLGNSYRVKVLVG